MLFFLPLSIVKEEVPDNDQERGNEEAEVVSDAFRFHISLKTCITHCFSVYFIVFTMFALMCPGGQRSRRGGGCRWRGGGLRHGSRRDIR